MLDLKFIRENPETIQTMLEQRCMTAYLNELLESDAQWRTIQGELEMLKQRHNLASKQIAQLGSQERRSSSLIGEVRQLSKHIKLLEASAKETWAQVQTHLLTIPNLPDPETPIGKSEADNVVLRHWGEPVQFDFDPRPHWEIAERLQLVDMDGAAKIAGSRFVAFRGQGARLERALINFMLDLHTQEHGYEEVAIPLLVNRKSMTGTGQLPRMEEDMYRCEIDDLFLIPTAEVPVTNLLADEILDVSTLPICYTACTPCFRREAGSYGRDTRGLIRVHQFDKVELVKFVLPETSEQEHESLLGHAEEVLRRLGLHYRVVNLCSADISFAAAKCYDLEVWAPGQQSYLEVSSCSNFMGFQARRASIRFRRHLGAKLEFVHTLNASGLALPRTVVALLETYQLSDGRVEVPAVLRAYMNDLTHLGI